ncbi:MAG: prepilin-type N-terminal cleavage/methylation domain-containing protein [Chloroflexi bacterium]|nr:MAG: prepilin-type N-terminal cleavage/methylation domain-containing protein [Chloroflexota bacterium]TMD51914.1 MAG: prepilin-type N-terminal cleavage/methylation domain-containing protein [Chloroflexota bacterium]
MRTVRRRALHLLRQAAKKNNQKGFTLIELLVVISILGILAAVVTMSMVGITKVATQRAADTEVGTVQTAMDTMLADQGVDPSVACASLTGSTNQMDAFPSNSKYVQAGGTGPLGGHQPVALYPQYLRDQKTHGDYSCSGNGIVTQTNYTP